MADSQFTTIEVQDVFIRELILEVTGTYACAVDVIDEIEIYTVVKLNVRGGEQLLLCLSRKKHVLLIFTLNFM